MRICISHCDLGIQVALADILDLMIYTLRFETKKSLVGLVAMIPALGRVQKHAGGPGFKSQTGPELVFFQETTFLRSSPIRSPWHDTASPAQQCGSPADLGRLA